MLSLAGKGVLEPFPYQGSNPPILPNSHIAITKAIYYIFLCTLANRIYRKKNGQNFGGVKSGLVARESWRRCMKLCKEFHRAALLTDVELVVVHYLAPTYSERYAFSIQTCPLPVICVVKVGCVFPCLSVNGNCSITTK